MTDPERKICRYYNTLGGCWYGDKCKFLHIPNKRPPCKFYTSANGCRFGESCHFSHDNLHMGDSKTDDVACSGDSIDTVDSSGSNNNNTEDSSQKTDGLGNSGQAAAELDGKANLELTEYEVSCGLCHRKLHLDGNESYCNLLKNHYLECFLDKEGDHIKYVKIKAAMEPGQMYWCKQCMLVFEKPWSLFQHMADKAKGAKTARWDKKLHLEWLDNVAGLMAAYDLGLFSPSKLRMDLRNVLADQNSVDEEQDSSVANVHALVLAMQLMNNPLNPMAQWRMQQTMNREICRKIDQLSRGSGSSFVPNSTGGSGGPGPSSSSRGGRGRGRGRGVSSRPPPMLVNTDQSGPGGPMLTGACGDLASSPSDLPNCGFTDEEVEELLNQGFKPWDPAALEVLAALHGEYDYLLQKEYKNEHV